MTGGGASKRTGRGRSTSTRRRRRRNPTPPARTFEQLPAGVLETEPYLEDLPGSRPLLDLAATLSTPPSHTVRLLRPRDLVSLEVLAYACSLVDGDDGPELRPDGADARLEVRLPFQHIGERAWYEITTTTPPTNPGGAPPGGVELPEPPPTAVRAAHGSRLVLAVPEDERIAFSTAGLLAAVSRLPLRVPALATPREERRRPSAFGDVLANLGGGLVLTRDLDHLVVRTAPDAWLRSEAATVGLPGTLRTGHERITARRLLAAAVAVDLRDAGRTSPGSEAGPGILNRFEQDLREPIRIPRPRRRPAPPAADETAIEAPYRLLVAPSVHGGFSHSAAPVASPQDDTHVELWHSRLGVRRETSDGWVVDERPDQQRIVRAVWTRDIAFYDEAALEQGDPPPFDPFRTSLEPRDRRILVRQSAETAITAPEPVEVRRLQLSSLGASLDLHGAWSHEPYSVAGAPAIESWDHVAPMGRDQFVRVVYPGYLFPFGHRASLVKVTERKIKDPPADRHAPQARLYQRKFIVVGEPVRGYDQRDLPFREVRVRPLATPDLHDPALGGPHVVQGQDIFWPSLGTRKFLFTLDALDHDGRRVRLHAPLLFVASHVGAVPAQRAKIVPAYASDPIVAASGQATAFARSTVPGDTSLDVASLMFTGEPERVDPASQSIVRAVPRLARASVVIPAAQHLAPTTEPVTVTYPQSYLDAGFAAGTEVFLSLTQPLPVSYGSGTDRAGGFVQPDLAPTQLSRSLGAVGPLAATGGGTFDPQQLLAGVSPKLFGLFDLWEVLGDLGIDALPRFVTESLDEVSALVTDLQQLATAVDDAITRLEHDAQQANATVAGALHAVRADLTALRGDLTARVTAIVDAFADVLGPGATSTPQQVIGVVEQALKSLTGSVAAVRDAIAGAPLPPTVRAQLERLVAAIDPVLRAGDLVQQVRRFLDAIDPAGLSVRARFTWQPPMRPWPATGSPVFVPRADGFTLSVEVRASATGGTGVDVLAELRDFQLHLLPAAPLLRMEFGRIAFRSSSGRKPETDVVFGGMAFLGVLSFIETLQKLIPFDGFADPPYLDVSAEGVTAGFDLALPNVAVGVFSLENMSLGADVRVPFLGDAVTVGFNFCTRERPFRLTVMAIGGGGFVAIRLSPQGLVVLEMSLEAGASLSLNLGVASGSVSVMVGLYLRLEADKGSLTGYFRIRGEVSVLGLISASITLELSLTYEFASGKMVGRASVVVEVSVLFFSASVEISVERRLAGSNQDPTFAQIMDVSDTGASDAWDRYCRAFAAS